MSFGNPRSRVNTTAPSTPSGTTSNTDTGTDQLSYSAARHRKTTSNDSAISAGAWLPDRISWKDRSEEHTSELQSLMRISYAVFCLKKKTTKQTRKQTK